MVNIFNGVPIDTQAFSIFDATYYIFYKDYKYYIYNYATNTTSAGVAFGNGTSVMSQIPTGQTINMGYVDAPNSWIYINVGSNWYKYSYTLSSGIPTFTYIQTISNSSWFGGGMPTSGWDGLAPYSNGINMWLFNGSSYNQFAYGGTGQPFDGLPHDIGCIDIRIDDTFKGWAFKGDKYYEISLTYSEIGGGTSLIGRRPNGGTLVSSGTIPSSGSLLGASVVNIFDGVPWDHSSSVSFDNDPTITYFFRMDPTTNLNKVYIHDETTNTTTVSDIGIPTMFPDLPTNIPITHGSENQPQNIGEHLIYWLDNTLSPPLQFIVTTSPTAVPVFIGSGNNNYVYHTGSSVEQVSTSTQWNAVLGWNFFYADRGSISHYLPTGNYGGVGQPYAGLPYIAGGPQVETEYCSILRVLGQDNQVYLFTPTGDAIILDLLAQQISTTVPYGPIAPSAPPTPLPNIEIVYQAPAQFNLFASDVALVTENQYGWNFTKTINDANKMELYLYFLQPGNPVFYYNELLELTVNMKNNLVMGTGNLFFNVYTVGSAGGWYGTKTTYFGNPDLGTTIDTNLVERIIAISDSRTDQILAISIGTNSAQQQVNLDVENVSFNVLVPATNNTQRVIVKLQNNFIVLDNNYWNLDTTATARLNTTIIPAFDINSFSPNIVAGNFPQNATARESTSGCALYVSGTWQLWETTDGTTWTATPNATMTLKAGGGTPIPPGPSSNGFAYIGTAGLFDNYGTGLPTAKRPVTWSVTTSNEFLFVWTGTNGQRLAPLANMTTPNNFTGAQMASGYFDTNAAAGSPSVAVWISSATSPSGEPVASRDIDIVVKSETEISIKRSWELFVTTYIINPSNPKEITGQYTDPAYTTSVAPTSFSMPSNWIEVANNDFRFEILFSAGLNNSLPAESQNFRQMTVTPSPTNTEITFAWVANYYTAGNILIGPVADIQTTGLVSGFTTGGSLKPSNAAYILYGCTSSENVDAINSLVFIEPDAGDEPFVLLFSEGLSNVIPADGSYSVSVDPDRTGDGITYTYTAKFYDKNDVFLGDVPGFGTSGPSSTFNITISTLPLGTEYISYICTSSTSFVSQLSLVIFVPCKPSNFRLDFSGGTNNIIEVDGTYSVFPDPVETTATYAYSADFHDIDDNIIGPVPGIGTSGNVSSFTITYATLPPLYAYILYTCSATGGDQGGGSQRLSITLLQTPEINRPPHTTVSMEQSSSMGYVNEDYTGSHKYLHEDNMTDLKLEVLDNNNEKKVCQNPLDYEIEVKYIGDI